MTKITAESMAAKITAAVAAGALLRTSDEYKAFKFKGGEKVVSEWGTEGVVTETRAGRPSRIDVKCQLDGCGKTRNIASQDFFQVVACGDSHRSELAKLGLERKGVNRVGAGTGRATSVPKLLKQALELGLIDQAKHDADLKLHEEMKAAKRAEQSGGNEEARKARVLKQLQARGFLGANATTSDIDVDVNEQTAE